MISTTANTQKKWSGWDLNNTVLFLSIAALLGGRKSSSVKKAVAEVLRS
jgi:hypothetical protein